MEYKSLTPKNDARLKSVIFNANLSIPTPKETIALLNRNDVNYKQKTKDQHIINHILCQD